jgi:hypothetical protein
MSELKELEEQLLVIRSMAGFWVKADARAWVKAEISRIEAEIAKLKEKTND